MKIIECGGFTIVLLPDHDLMLILSPHGIEFKCLKCFYLRDVYMFDGGQKVPWLRMCTCPHGNHDTVPLSNDQLPPELQTSDLSPFEMPADVRRFIERRDEA
jgi:hypothetical protein